MLEFAVSTAAARCDTDGAVISIFLDRWLALSLKSMCGEQRERESGKQREYSEMGEGSRLRRERWANEEYRHKRDR